MRYVKTTMVHTDLEVGSRQSPLGNVLPIVYCLLPTLLITLNMEVGGPF